MSGGAVLSCGEPPGEEDICQRLAREIEEMVNRDKRACNNGGTHGLRHRFREQIEGANGPGTSEWENHDQAIKNQQRGLRDRLNDYDANNCGSRIPIPQDAWSWATRPAPAPEQWRGPAERSVTEPGLFDLEYWRRVTGLTGIALVLYLIVSEGSRLFPPRNLVPVP